MVEGRKEFITDAVIPLVEKRKQVINNWLAPKFGENLVVEFDYGIFAELSEDMAKVAASANIMWWLTGNERRAMTNYDRSENPNMDKYLVPSNLIPLDDLSMDFEQIDEELLKPDNNQ